MQVAYIPQAAFIYNATVRENILFGQPFEEERYQRAIEAAALGPDLLQLSGASIAMTYLCITAPLNPSYVSDFLQSPVVHKASFS